jgi:hypothetical protein
MVRHEHDGHEGRGRFLGHWRAGQIFAANQWNPAICSAQLVDDEAWSDLPTPPQISQGSDGGIPFLAYDDAHGILYASMFSGGVARIIVH